MDKLDSEKEINIEKDEESIEVEDLKDVENIDKSRDVEKTEHIDETKDAILTDDIKESVDEEETSNGIFKEVKIALYIIISTVAFFGIPFLQFYLTNSYLFDPREFLNRDKTIVNYLFFAFILWAVFLLVGRFRVATILTTVFYMIFGLADYFVYNFRGNPILPWDINSVRTAASVADNYDYTIEKYVWKIIFGFIGLIILECLIEIKLRFKLKNIIVRFVGICACFLAIWGLIKFLSVPENMSKLECYPFLFQQDVMTKRNGVMLTFMYDMNFIKVDKPKGYSDKKAKSYLEEYESLVNEIIACDDNGNTITNLDRNSNNYAANGTPDVVVIMNESFSDLSVIGDFETNEDYMPFIHSIMEGADDTVSGFLNVSVVGGNTPNTEYEFLTGDTMNFLPMGSIPYQQYMFGERDSLVSQLDDLGYETSAMHPYYEKGWNRYNVYEYFGFDETLFKDDVEGSRVRNYFSDESVTDYLIEKSENAGDKPMFNFVVTMQNHSSYTEVYDNLPQNIKVKGLEGYDAVSNYFSLVKLTDEAVEELVDYYKTCERDTVLVFFGDHQPNTTVANPILRMNGINPIDMTEEENAQRYKVPYFIWANFDIEEESYKDISVNYLAEVMVDKTGIKKTPYQGFLKDLQEEYPVISAAGVWDKSGNSVDNPKSIEDIKKYNIIQYYKMGL